MKTVFIFALGLVTLLLSPISYGTTINLPAGGSIDIGDTKVTCDIQGGGGEASNSFCECKVSRTSMNFNWTQFYYDVFLTKVIAGKEYVQQLTTTGWYGGDSIPGGPDNTYLPSQCVDALNQLPQCR